MGENFLPFYGPAANCDELGKLGYTEMDIIW